VGIVRLSGRYTGFLAMEASFASRSVNICLIPEFSFDLYGKRGLLNYIFQRIKAKGSCVIVVSYGTSIIISLVI
jgi:6-phosphofructokinase 1